MHHPASAEILMTDLAVAHRSARKAHVPARSADQGPGIGSKQCVTMRRIRQLDGIECVVLRMGITAPPVTDDQHDRAFEQRHRAILGQTKCGRPTA